MGLLLMCTDYTKGDWFCWKAINVVWSDLYVYNIIFVNYRETASSWRRCERVYSVLYRSLVTKSLFLSADDVLLWPHIIIIVIICIGIIIPWRGGLFVGTYLFVVGLDIVYIRQKTKVPKSFWVLQWEKLHAQQNRR